MGKAEKGEEFGKENVALILSFLLQFCSFFSNNFYLFPWSEIHPRNTSNSVAEDEVLLKTTTTDKSIHSNQRPCPRATVILDSHSK